MGDPLGPIPAVPAAQAAGATVGLYAPQPTIYARSVRGWFAGWRWALVWLTQLLFYGLPWLDWGSRPAVLFDLAARRFYIGPLVLYPQDFIYLTGLLILSAYGLFLFTAVAGRLWCGFACPQTVYTEIFMWVERRFEGDRAARMKRDAGPWTPGKLGRKAGKHAAWALIGLWTGFSFVGYFTPIHELGAACMSLFGLAAAGVAAPGPWETFWVLFYGFATYGNAGFMREQVCKYMCPYARFQSAMFDKDTLIIGYDASRGDPRGSRPRSLPHAALAAQGKGDCIDCSLCVQVCPTGIDIRRGLQYECIGCASCVDVCNGVMDKMAYPRGLIRFDSQRGLAAGGNSSQRWRRVLRPRVLVYAAILLLVSAAFVASLVSRTPFRVDVVRDRGSLARLVDDGRIENVYRLQVMNASERRETYHISVEGLPGLVMAPAPVKTITVEATEARWVPVAVQLPPESAAQLGGGAHAVRFLIHRVEGTADGEGLSEASTFVVPR